MTAPHIQRVVGALSNLMRRLDNHFDGDPANDWREQAEARSALAEFDRVEVVGTRHSSTDSHAVMAAEIARLREAMTKALAIVTDALCSAERRNG